MNINLNNDMFNNGYVIDPSSMVMRIDNPKTVYIYPVRNKTYNIERIFSYNNILNIIKGIRSHNNIVIITKDTDIKIDQLRKGCNRNLTNLTSIPWHEIINTIITDGERLITGDCGLTHFFSLLRPDYQPRLIIYYKTKSFINNNPMNEFDKKIKVVNFKPYSPYSLDKISIRTF